MDVGETCCILLKPFFDVVYTVHSSLAYCNDRFQDPTPAKKNENPPPPQKKKKFSICLVFFFSLEKRCDWSCFYFCLSLFSSP